MVKTPRTPSRRGLTLVELLVVIAIIAGLAALLVLIFPTLQDSQRAAKGADIVQGQLFVARQMALRDQQPRGVRLVASGNFGQTITVNGQQQFVPFFDQLQLIEQPAAYATGVVPNLINNPNTTWPQDPTTGWYIVPFQAADPNNPATMPDFRNGVVQPGDFLDLSAASDLYSLPPYPNSGAMHLIMKVQAAAPPAQQQVWVLTPPNIKYTGSPFPFYYRILRSPRPLTGEGIVNLPNGVVVDATSDSLLYSNASPPQGSIIPADTDGNREILFDPAGKVLRASGSQGKVVLWVKDTTALDKWGDQTLVAVYTRVGLITAQPVNVNNSPPHNPNNYFYDFVKDGATSGM